ncbi:GntR family transcriptional regulator [Thermohalobacter berrensis]|uniref:GntR family transcriptional regulator n=1 Tax=Thermohalobacter berrensis TaxID=99594 RepID=A0A419T3X5_9FIRM|nr:GntR family transcriptional regulator [Thermohalobacter berrensis]RKD32254.1 GntR family transcriptional regulator [Thermohalobacter berrensis]
MKKVSKQNPLPLYYQLKEILQEMIENEVLKPGDPIPPERELCEIHGISRMTARKAVMALVNEGILYREQGKGTFVAKPKIKKQISRLKGLTEEMGEKGLKVDTELLSFEIKEATKKVRKHLNISEDKKVIEVKRLRKIEDEPIAIETAWVPHSMCPDLTKELIENNSLYQTFKEKYGYSLDHAKQTIEPIKVNEYESSLLDVDMENLALLFRRKTYLNDGRVIEYTKAIYRSDKYKYEVILR